MIFFLFNSKCFLGVDLEMCNFVSNIWDFSSYVTATDLKLNSTVVSYMLGMI